MEFKGFIINGKPNGYGALNKRGGKNEGTYKCIFKDGSFEEGEYQYPMNEIKHGKIVLPYRIYTGSFKGYEKQGYGCY